MEPTNKIKKEAGNVCLQRRSPTLQVVPVLFIFLALSSCEMRPAFAEINIDALANSIRKAEGNSNYGILTKYKTTTPRQACKNTIRHALKDFTGEEKDFISFLGGRYAPRFVANDPKDLNKNWIPNVTKFYEKEVSK
jgi:hypothetical protein